MSWLMVHRVVRRYKVRSGGSNEQEGGLPYALSQYLTTHAKKCVLCVMASPRVIDKSEQLLIPTFHRFAFVTTM